MNTVNHKGYTARIEFDDRENIFVGRVLGLRTMIRVAGNIVAASQVGSVEFAARGSAHGW